MHINYHIFKKALSPFLCFSIQDVRKHFPGFDRKRLTEWQRKGYIEKVVRGYYVFRDEPKDIYFWWYAANRIFEPSYISLQSALDYYGFIPEVVFQITSITTKKTRKLNGPETQFLYRNMKEQHYLGYWLLPLREDHHIRLAEPEKALLDLLYLNPSIKRGDDFEAWRLNRPLMKESLNMSLMEQYAGVMRNRTFYDRFKTFKKWLNA